jgi:MFS transporter, DHA2 family, multidrug resistance protein
MQQHVRLDIAPTPLAGARRAWVLGAALGAIFIDQSASAVATSALAPVQGAFGLGPDEGSWFLTLFNASYYTSILASIWMIARLGRKRLLLGALLAYSAFTLLCVLAPNATALIALRMAQGVAEGALFTTAAMIIFTVHQPSEMARAFFGFSIVSVAGSTLGPLMAGSLVEFGGWESAFGWSALMALAAAAVLFVALPLDRTQRRVRFDWVGLALAFAAFVPFQYLVNEAERRDWFADPGVVFAALAFAALAAAFAVWKLWLAPHPFVDLRVLTVWNLAVGASISAVVAAAGYTSTLFVQYAQTGAGFSPTEAGWALGLRVIAVCLGVPAIGLAVLAGWTNARWGFMVSFALFVGGLLLSTTLMTSASDFAAFVPLTLAIGFVQGVANQPLPALIFGGLTPQQAPMGAVVFKMAPLLAGALANAASQRLLDLANAVHLSELAGAVSLHAPAVATLVRGGGGSTLGALVARQATVLAYGDVTRWIALAALIALPMALLLRLPRRS